MGKIESKNYAVSLLVICSVILNLYFVLDIYVGGNYKWSSGGSSSRTALSWSKRAAAEAEAVADINCSGHGRAYLDGLVVDEDEKPICECHTCYGGPDCSHFYPSCSVNADGGDPLFLEPFWIQHAASSALVVAGWHRMSYSYGDGTTISAELEKHIRKLHAIVGNAVTEGRCIIFGVGSTQLLNAAVRSFSPDNSSKSPANVVASIPFYPVYQLQTEFYKSEAYKFKGDASLWKNNSDTSADMIEFVTSPNNPDGQLKKAVLDGPNVNVIYDHAYYWPHFTAIPAPADGDLMIFTLSKLTGHAGSRFGWAIIKDEAIYERMRMYLELNTMGISRDVQLRALKLLNVVLAGRGRDMFEFGHSTMAKRWQKLTNTVSMSKRFALQNIASENCTFFQRVRKASPAYAWLKCEREEDNDCYATLQAGNITGRKGSIFFADDRHLRLSLIRSEDDFDLLIHKLKEIISKEDGPKTM